MKAAVVAGRRPTSKQYLTSLKNEDWVRSSYIALLLMSKNGGIVAQIKLVNVKTMRHP